MRAVPFRSVMDPRWKNIEFVSTPFAHLDSLTLRPKTAALIAQHERKLPRMSAKPSAREGTASALRLPCAGLHTSLKHMIIPRRIPMNRREDFARGRYFHQLYQQRP